MNDLDAHTRAQIERSERMWREPLEPAFPIGESLALIDVGGTLHKNNEDNYGTYVTLRFLILWSENGPVAHDPFHCTWQWRAESSYISARRVGDIPEVRHQSIERWAFIKTLADGFNQRTTFKALSSFWDSAVEEALLSGKMRGCPVVLQNNAHEPSGGLRATHALSQIEHEYVLAREFMENGPGAFAFAERMALSTQEHGPCFGSAEFWMGHAARAAARP